MYMELSNNRNKHGVKDSCNQYRNINGVFYECYATDPCNFEAAIKECNELGLKYKIIKTQLFRERKCSHYLRKNKIE